MTPSSAHPFSALRPASALLVVPLALVLAAALPGCGGTNSETPWPVEPEDVDLGPEGESHQNERLGAPAGSGAAAPTTAPATAPAVPRETPRKEPRAPEPATPSNPSTQF